MNRLKRLWDESELRTAESKANELAEKQLAQDLKTMYYVGFQDAKASNFMLGFILGCTTIAVMTALAAAAWGLTR